MTTATLDVKENLKTVLREREENTESIPFVFENVSFRAGENNAALVTIEDDDYLLTDVAFRQIAETLEIPVPFAKRIDEELFDTVFNHQAQNGKAKNGDTISEQFRNALVVDGRVRSIAKPDNPYVPANAVFTVLEDAFEGDYDLKYLSVSDDKMSFSMLPHEYRNAIDGADLFGGLKVVFSESWSVFPQFDAYIWRELCANGMIDTLQGHKFRVSGKNEQQILEQVDAFAKLSIAKLPELYENFEKLLTESVGDYKKLIFRLCQEYKLPNKVRERLLFWAEQPEFLITISNQKIENMHDIVNLVTYAASHDTPPTMSPENAAVLMAIAGSITQKHDDRCGSCGVVL